MNVGLSLPVFVTNHILYSESPDFESVNGHLQLLPRFLFSIRPRKYYINVCKQLTKSLFHTLPNSSFIHVTIRSFYAALYGWVVNYFYMNRWSIQNT